MQQPTFIKKFILDFVEGFIAFLLAFNFVVPTSMDQVHALGFALAAGALDALVSAFRRDAPDFLAWLGGKVGVPPTPPSS